MAGRAAGTSSTCDVINFGRIYDFGFWIKIFGFWIESLDFGPDLVGLVRSDSHVRPIRRSSSFIAIAAASHGDGPSMIVTHQT
jgi:hypothetical protein